MGVPRAVLEQERKADEAIEKAQAEANARAAAESNPPRKPQPDLSPEAKVTPPAQPDQQPAAAADAQPTDELAVLRKEVDRERQLRKTLEGRLRSQLGPANEEIRRLREDLAEAQENIEKIRQQSQKPGAERYLSDEEREELGEVLDVNTRMVKGLIEEAAESGGVFGKKIDELVAKSDRAVEAQRTSGPSGDFWLLVDQYSPGSRKLNRDSDPRWLDFLDGFDRRSGVLNYDLAKQAMANDDPIALADLFDEFKRQYGIANAPAPEVPAGERSEQVVHPERVAAGDEKKPKEKPKAEKRMWTKAAIHAFYSDYGKGKFKGREKYAAEIEAEIEAAASEGRIRG